MMPQSSALPCSPRLSLEFHHLQLPYISRVGEILSRLRTPVYTNTGSVARDHLAAERTFLSWVRTSLGFVIFGIAVERFSQLDITTWQPNKAPRSPEAAHQQKQRKTETQSLVVGLIGTGSGTLVYGTARYFSNMRTLERELYKPSFYGAGGLALAVAGLTGAAYWTVIRQSPETED